MLNEDVKDSIHRLVSKVATRDNEMFLKDIFSSICRLAEEDINGGDWKLVSRSLKELRKSFSVFTPHRGTRKVAIFGSARTRPDDPLYQQAEQFSKAIVDANFMVITGAGGGIMEAGNKGAPGEKSFGVNIRLPFEQSANQYIQSSPLLITYNYFFIRKLIFIKESDATVLFPGGFGTLDEAYEGLTLIQTGKSLPRPIVLMQTPGSDYWQEWVSFFSKVMLRDHYISPDDMELFDICESVEDAVQKLTHFYKIYHSLRYVRDHAVIRINHDITDESIAELNDEFDDIIVEGKIDRSEPFEEERMSKDMLKKPRLAFKFNKVNYGRLCSLIRRINDCEIKGEN